MNLLERPDLLDMQLAYSLCLGDIVIKSSFVLVTLLTQGLADNVGRKLVENFKWLLFMFIVHFSGYLGFCGNFLAWFPFYHVLSTRKFQIYTISFIFIPNVPEDFDKRRG